MSLISLLVALLVIGVVIYIVNLIIQELPLPSFVKTIALLIVGLIGLAYILNAFGIVIPHSK